MPLIDYGSPPRLPASLLVGTLDCAALWRGASFAGSNLLPLLEFPFRQQAVVIPTVTLLLGSIPCKPDIGRRRVYSAEAEEAVKAGMTWLQKVRRHICYYRYCMIRKRKERELYRYFIEKEREKRTGPLRRTFWLEEDSPKECKRKMKVKARFVVHRTPAELERFKKLDDFRPETCERCWQLAWEKYVQEHFFPDPEPPLYPETRDKPVTREELEAYSRARIANMWWLPDWHRHLEHERHVFALLPPAQEGVKQG